MSKSIDQRIVDMRFNNAEFESGIKDSLQSIENLKKGLDNMDGISNGLSATGDAAEKAGLSFSTLEVIAVTALAKITSAVMDFALETAKSLTLDPIISGFREYESQTQAFKAIMNATQRSVEDVEEALKPLIFFADETSFSFDQMVNSVRMFTAAGVNLEDAVVAMQGIGSASALAGVNLSNMDSVFRNLSQAIGGGVLRLQDWKSLELAGLATSREFRQILMDTAVEMGTLNKVGEQYVTMTADSNGKINQTTVSLSNMSTTLKENWVTTEVLMSTFGQFGSYAQDVFVLVEASSMSLNDALEYLNQNGIEVTDEMLVALEGGALLASQAMDLLGNDVQHFSERGMRAAQEARTLTDALGSIGAAVASKWRDTWGLIIGNVDEATELWTAFTETLWDLLVVSGDVRNSLLAEWRAFEQGNEVIDGRLILLEGVKNIGNSLVVIIEAIQEAFANIFPPMTADRLIELTVKFKEFTEQLVPSERTLENITRTFQGLFAAIDIVIQVLGFIGGVIGKVVGAIFPFTGALLELTGGIGDLIVGTRDWIKESEIFGRALETIGKVIDQLKIGVVLGLAFILDSLADALDFLAPFVDGIENYVGNIAGNIIAGLRNGLSDGVQGCIDAIVTVATAIYEAIKNFFGINSPSLLMITLAGFIIAGLIKGLISGESELASAAGRVGTALLTGLEAAIKAIDLLIQGLSWVFLAGAEIIKWCVEQIGGYFSQFGGIDLGPLKIVSDETKELFKPFEAIANVAKTVFNGIITILTAIGDAIKKGLNALGIKDLETLIEWVFSGGILILLNQLLDFLKPFSQAFGGFGEIFDGLGSALEGFSKRLKAEALFTIAKALGVLAASLLVLAFLPFDSLMQGIAAIAALTGALSLLSKLGGTFDMVKMGAGMTGLGVGLLALSGAMAVLSLLSWESIGKGIATIAALMTVVGILGKLGSGNLVQFAAGLVLVGTGLTLMVVPLVALALIPFDLIADGLGTMAAILAVLAGASILTKSGTLLELGASLTLFAVGLTLMIVPLVALGLIPFEIIGEGLLAMAAALGILAIASKVTEPGVLLGMGAGLLAISAALVVLGAAFLVISVLSWEDLGKGLITLAAALTALVVASKLIDSDGGFIKMATTLLTIAGTLAILAAAFLVMSLLDLDNMLTTALSMSILLVAIGAFLVVMEQIGPSLGRALGIVATLAAFAAALTLLTAPFIALKLFGVDDTMETMVSLTGLLVVIGAFLVVVHQLGPDLLTGIEIVGILGLFAIALTLLTAPFIALKLFDVTDTLETMISLSGLLVVIGAFIAIVGNIPIIAGLTAVANLAIFVVGLAALLTVLGALAQIPGFNWIVDEGIDLLVKMGYGLGEFVGSIIGGFLGGISNGFPQIAENLSLFMDNLQPFLDGVKDIDASVMSGVESLVNAILKLTVTSLIDGIASFLGFGETSFVDFGKSLAEFGPYFAQYYESIKDVDGNVVQASANAAMALTELAKSLPAKGGVLQEWIGTKDLSVFAKELTDFGPALMEYSNSISGLDASAVTSSANAAGALAKLANNLPAKGGILQDWIGTKDLSVFALELADFGPTLMEYAASVTGLDASVVTNSANAALALANLANKLPAKGGIVQDWVGTKSLSSFAYELKAFGPAMKDYAESVSGLDAGSVEASANAALALSNLANNLPAKGGVVQGWMGTQDLSIFAQELTNFGPAMKTYADSVAGINPDAVAASANAALALSELANNLPAKGGVVQEWSGTKDLSTFAKELADFGPAMKIYGDSVAGINPEAVESSANAALALANLAKNLPPVSGISTWFGKAKDLSTFATEIADFGPAMQVYADSVAGIDGSAVTTSTNAALALAELANNLPAVSGISSWFGSAKDLSTFAKELTDFGPAMKVYSDSVLGLDNGAITSSSSAALALAELANGLPSKSLIDNWTGSKDLSIFAQELTDFGPAMKAYADSVTGIDGASVVSSASAAKALSEIAETLPAKNLIDVWTGSKDLSNFAKELVDFGPAMKTYADSVTGIDAASVQASANAAIVLADMAQNMPANGFASWLTGSSTLSDFGKELAKFGPHMKTYGDSVVGVDGASIEASATAASLLVNMANDLPPSGGWFSNVQTLADFGSNLKTFGGRLAEYATSIRNVDANDLKTSSEGVALLVEMAKGVVSLDTSKMLTFGSHLKQMGDTGMNEFIAAFTGAETKVMDAIDTMIGFAEVKLRDISAPFTQAGQDGVSALILGIESKEAELKTAITSLGQDTILETFSNAVGWRSPWASMVEAGEDGVSGLQIGMENEAPNLGDTAEGIGGFTIDSLNDGFSGGMGNLADTLRGMADSLRNSLTPVNMEGVGEGAMEEFADGLIKGTPSVVNVGESSGNDLMNGMADGITSGTPAAVSATKKANNDIAKEMADARKKQFEEEKKDILHRRALGQLNLYEEYEEWRAIQAKYAEGTEERRRAVSEMVDMVIAYRQMGVLSTQEELAAWEYANAQYIEDIDVRRRVELELYETRKRFAKEVFEAEVNGIKDRRAANEISVNQELLELSLLSRKYAENSEERTKLEEEMARTRAEITKGEFEEAKKQIEQKRELQQVNLEWELEAWDKIQAKYAEGSEERRLADKEMFDAIIAYRQMNELSLLEEYETWTALQERYIEGSEERMRVELELSDLRKRVNEEQIRITEEIDKLEAEYAKSVEQRAQTIYNSFSLFAEVKEKDIVAGRDLIKNLQDQVDELRNWASNLQILARRGVDEGLLEELRKMGPGANAEITALSRMTDSELTMYQQLWKEKNATARELAIAELVDLRKETEEEIKALKADLEKLDIFPIEKFNEASAEAMEALLSGFTNLEEMERVGTAIAQAVEDGITLNEKALEQIGERYGVDFSSALSNTQTQAKTSGEGVSGKAVEGLGTNAASYAKTGTQYGQDFSTAVSNTGPQAKTSGQNVTNQASDGLKTNAASYGQTGTQYGQDFARGLDNSKSNGYNAGLAFSNEALRGLSSNEYRWQESGQTAGNNFNNGLNNKSWDVYNSGQIVGGQAVQGMVDGINMRLYDAEIAGYNLGYRILEGARRALDTNSPSEETKQIAIFAGQGAIIGLEIMGRSVENSAYSLGRGAVHSLAEAMKGIADIVAQDIDMSPTIRPVIDFDDIDRAANRLSDIFSKQRRINLDLSMVAETSNTLRSAAVSRARHERSLESRVQPVEINNYFDMAGMIVREDQDINRIATQLEQKQQGALRGRGGQAIIRRR